MLPVSIPDQWKQSILDRTILRKSEQLHAPKWGYRLQTGGWALLNPKEMEDKTPSVGIFWFFRGEIIADAIPVTQGDECGKFINHPLSHHDFWNAHRKKDRRLNAYDYDQVPRGRVLYDKEEDRYLVYGSERFIQDEAQRTLVCSTFLLVPTKTFFKAEKPYEPRPGVINYLR